MTLKSSRTCITIRATRLRDQRDRHETQSALPDRDDAVRALIAPEGKDDTAPSARTTHPRLTRNPSDRRPVTVPQKFRYRPEGLPRFRRHLTMRFSHTPVLSCGLLIDAH